MILKNGGAVFKINILMLTKSVDANLTLTQNAYSSNWAGTEVGVISWTFNSNSILEKQVSEKLNNKNTLKLAFGQTINQDITTFFPKD